MNSSAGTAVCGARVEAPQVSPACCLAGCRLRIPACTFEGLLGLPSGQVPSGFKKRCNSDEMFAVATGAPSSAGCRTAERQVPWRWGARWLATPDSCGSALHCTALDDSVLHCLVLRCTAWCCTALHACLHVRPSCFTILHEI